MLWMTTSLSLFSDLHSPRSSKRDSGSSATGGPDAEARLLARLRAVAAFALVIAAIGLAFLYVLNQMFHDPTREADGFLIGLLLTAALGLFGITAASKLLNR